MADGFYNRVTRAIPIQTASVSLKDLEQLAKIIESKNAEAVSLERMSINDLLLAEDEKAKYTDLIPSIQKLTIFIYGADGENVISYDPSIFQNHLLPPKISEVTIETQTFRQVQAKGESPNHIRLHFDFARFSYGSAKVTFLWSRCEQFNLASAGAKRSVGNRRVQIAQRSST